MSQPNYSPDFYVRKARYPKRTERKVNTMFRIYECLPSHFNAIKKALDLSDTTVSKRLGEMKELHIVKLEREKQHIKGKKNDGEWWCNVYKKNPEFENVLLKYRRGLSLKEKFEWEVILRLELVFNVRKRGSKAVGEIREERVSMSKEWEDMVKKFKKKSAPC